MDIIGNREPHELLMRAMAHIREKMSVIREINYLYEVSAWNLMPAHSALAEAHEKLAWCCTVIITEPASCAN